MQYLAKYHMIANKKHIAKSVKHLIYSLCKISSSQEGNKSVGKTRKCQIYTVKYNPSKNM